MEKLKEIVEKIKSFAIGKDDTGTEEDDLADQIYQVGRDMEQSRKNYEFATDDTLVDMYIYTLKAQEMKYKHLLEKAKRRNAS